MGIISLTQYVHPHRKEQIVSVELPDEVCEMAKNQVLSCECMPNDYGHLVLYSYPIGCDPDDDPGCEQCLIAENGPGENSPTEVLERLIRKVNERNNTGK